MLVNLPAKAAVLSRAALILSILMSLVLPGMRSVQAAAAPHLLRGGVAALELAAGPALSITKTVSPDSDVTYHGTVTYTITLANSGPTDAANVQVMDALPASTTFAYWVEQPSGASAAADEITWSGTVTAGGALRFTFAVSQAGDLGERVENVATYIYQGDAGGAKAAFTVQKVYTMHLPLVARSWRPVSMFGYGIQAHGEHRLPEIVSSVQDLGLGWVKQQVRWEDIEGTRGNYGWSGLDAIVDAYNQAGLQVLFSVTAAPSWARRGKPGDGPPDDYQDLSTFASAMAAHFRGRVQAYEIWNEPNVRREWEGAPLSAADYVRLLEGAYRAIKGADPAAIVVSGAPAPTGINDGVEGIDDRVFLEQMYGAGLEDFCDAVGAHPYGFANPPDVYYTGGDFDPGRGWDDQPYFFFRNTMEDYYGIMLANGDGGKQIWATEFGWPTVDGMYVLPNRGREYAADIDEGQQADYTVRAYTWARDWGHAGVMVLWNLNMWPVVGPGNEMAKYSIVRADWSPRPVYMAVRDMPK